MMKISRKTWTAALLVMVGVLFGALQVRAACNAADGTQVTLEIIGPEYVGPGEVCTMPIRLTQVGIFGTT